MAGFDFSSINVKQAASKAGRCVLRHPITNEPLLADNGEEVFLMLLGSDSDEYKKADRANQKIRAEKAMRSRKAIPSGEELEADHCTLLSKVTTGFGNVVIEGQKMEFSAQNARKLYQDFDWVREQASDYVHDRANYLESSASN